MRKIFIIAAMLVGTCFGGRPSLDIQMDLLKCDESGQNCCSNQLLIDRGTVDLSDCEYLPDTNHERNHYSLYYVCRGGWKTIQTMDGHEFSVMLSMTERAYKDHMPYVNTFGEYDLEVSVGRPGNLSRQFFKNAEAPIQVEGPKFMLRDGAGWASYQPVFSIKSLL